MEAFYLRNSAGGDSVFSRNFQSIYEWLVDRPHHTVLERTVRGPQNATNVLKYENAMCSVKLEGVDFVQRVEIAGKARDKPTVLILNEDGSSKVIKTFYVETCKDPFWYGGTWDIVKTQRLLEYAQ